MSLPTKPFQWVANYTPVPNEFFEIGPYLTEPELRIMLYAIRHTIGWDSKRDTREAHISVRNFANGYTLKGITYEGTHLTEVTIRKALIELVKLGLLERVGGITEIGQLWKLPQGCDAAALQKREDDRYALDQKRTVNGRKKAEEKRQSEGGGLSDNGGYPIDENEGLSDNAPQGYEITPSSKERTTKEKEKERTTIAPSSDAAPAPSQSLDPQSSSIVEGEKTSTPKTAQGKAKDKDKPPPSKVAPKVPPTETREETRDQMLARSLGEAWGIPPSKSDYGLYIKKARKMAESMPVEKFKAFCDYRKREAGDFADKITIQTLPENGWISKFLAWDAIEGEKIRQFEKSAAAYARPPRRAVSPEEQATANRAVQFMKANPSYQYNPDDWSTGDYVPTTSAARSISAD